MEYINIAEIVTWPQALIAGLIIIAVVVVPQIMQYLQSRGIKHQFQNNSGSTMRDAVDRIESKLGVMDERLAELESAKGRHTD